MKIHTALAVVAVALFCFTDAVDAQGGGRGGRGGRGGGGPGSRIGAAQLLGVEAVQQELQITAEQLEALGGLTGNRRGGGGGAQGRPGGGGRGQGGADGGGRGQGGAGGGGRGQGGAGGGGRGQGGAGGGGRGQGGGGRGAGGAGGAEMDEQLAEILNEAQIKRLNEIRINVLGANALTDSKVAEAVGLTTDDVQKIEEARSAAFAEMRQNMMQNMSGGGGDRSAMMEKMQEMRASVDKSIMEMLTEEQATRFQTLKGEPFELDMRELMMGGRGGQGGPGGRGGGGAGGRPGGGGGPSGRPGQ